MRHFLFMKQINVIRLLAAYMLIQGKIGCVKTGYFQKPMQVAFKFM